MLLVEVLKKYLFFLESNEQWRNMPFAVTTSNSQATQKSDTNLNSTQLNYNLMLYNKDSQPKQNRQHSRRTSKSFLAFQCELCGTRTTNENNMKVHFERKHIAASRDYHQHFRQLHHLFQSSQQNSLLKKTTKKPFKCKSCKRTTLTLKSMERHQQLYHGPNANFLAKQCNICHKRILKEKFEPHIKAHFSSGFNCNYCGVVYKNKRYIEKHIKKYHGGKNF